MAEAPKPQKPYRFPNLEHTYPPSVPTDRTPLDKILRAINYWGYTPSFSSDGQGNLTLTCISFDDADTVYHVVRAGAEANDDLRFQMMVEMARKVGMPEKWVPPEQ